MDNVSDALNISNVCDLQKDHCLLCVDTTLYQLHSHFSAKRVVLVM